MIDREVRPHPPAILAGVVVASEDVFLAERQALAVGPPDIAQQADDGWKWQGARRGVDDTIAHLHILRLSLQDHDDRPPDVAEVERLVGMIKHQYLDAVDAVGATLSAYIGFHRSIGERKV